MGKVILILGGARSGKSTTAEQLAQQIGGDEVLFVATAEGKDPEMQTRIFAHRQQRPAGWQTLEAPRHPTDDLSRMTLPAVVVVDCITLLVSNLLLTLPDDCTQAEANRAVLGEIDALVSLQQVHPATWILVSNEVGMGIVPPFPLGRLYRDALGMANQRLARAANEVILMVAGLRWYLKGR